MISTPNENVFTLNDIVSGLISGEIVCNVSSGIHFVCLWRRYALLEVQPKSGSQWCVLTHGFARFCSYLVAMTFLGMAGCGVASLATSWSSVSASTTLASPAPSPAQIRREALLARICAKEAASTL